MNSEIYCYGRYGENPTKDGTCIRDYIDVMDLAEAHIKSLEFILEPKNDKNFEVINIGTGKGHSVFQIIKIFEKVTKKKLMYKEEGLLLLIMAKAKDNSEIEG